MLFSIGYSPFHNNDFRDNDDPIDDISNTKADNVCMDPSNSTRGTHFNITGDVGVSVIPIFLLIMRMSVYSLWSSTGISSLDVL